MTYCIQGSDLESLFKEDENMFLVAFLDANEDEMSMVSIRSTVIDVFSEVLEH